MKLIKLTHKDSIPVGSLWVNPKYIVSLQEAYAGEGTLVHLAVTTTRHAATYRVNEKLEDILQLIERI
jgi:hypothetical protein